MNDPPWFEVGDLVRLKRGWTAMEVIKTSHNSVWACYGPDLVRAWEQSNKQDPHEFCSQVRPREEFVPWDPKEARKVSSQARNRFKHQTRHVLKDEPTEEEDEMSKQKTLYSWKVDGVEKFGAHIGTMPDGRWVMAPAEGGEPVVGQSSEFAEVIPYSIEIENLSDKGQRPTHVWVDKAAGLVAGQVILWSSGDLCRIKAVDTKSKHACQWVDGLVLDGRVITPKE